MTILWEPGSQVPHHYPTLTRTTSRLLRNHLFLDLSSCLRAASLQTWPCQQHDALTGSSLFILPLYLRYRVPGSCGWPIHGRSSSLPPSIWLYNFSFRSLSAETSWSPTMWKGIMLPKKEVNMLFKLKTCGRANSIPTWSINWSKCHNYTISQILIC